MHNTQIFDSVLILLISSVIFATLFRRMRIEPALGYIAAGAILGPSAFQILPHGTELHQIAELGIIFLMFTIGLHISIDQLKRLKRYVFGFGSAQVIVTSIILSGAAWIFGLPANLAILTGTGLSLSSTALVMKLLEANNENNTHKGRAAFSVLLMQDLAVAPILALAPLAVASGSTDMIQTIIALGKGIAFTGAIILVGRFIIRPAFHIIAETKSHDIFVATTLAVAVGTAWLTHHLGLSMALGAFLAGLLLAETEYRHQIEADINPFKGIFMAIFFLTIGAAVSLNVVAQNFMIILTIAVAIIFLKAIIITGLAKLFGISSSNSLYLGGLLSQAGEFSFVVIGIAGLAMPGDSAAIIIASATLSMALTPLAIKLTNYIANSGITPLDVDHLKEVEETETEDRVLIAGFGRAGRTVAAVLDDLGVKYAGIDNEATRALHLRRQGTSVYWGDATSPSIWKQLKAEHARAIVIAMEDTAATKKTVSMLKEAWPEVQIIARAHDLANLKALKDIGVSRSVPGTAEPALKLAELAAEAVGRSHEESIDATDAFRQNEYKKLRPVFENPMKKNVDSNKKGSRFKFVKIEPKKVKDFASKFRKIKTEI